MRCPRFRPLIAAACVLAVLTACGRGRAATAEPSDEQAAESLGGGAGAIPPAELYGATAAENVRAVPVELGVRDLPAAWDGVKIAAISDLQLGLWRDNAHVAETAIRAALANDADVIALLGGYTARSDDELATLSRVLAPLRGRAAVAVLGQKDVRTDSTEARTVRALSDAGVRVLRNDRLQLTRGGDTLFIAGLSPDFVTFPDWRRAEIFSVLGGAPSTPLLLTYPPTTIYAVPRDRFAAVLAGNTNCGRVDVPGTPELSTLRNETFANLEIDNTGRAFRIDGNALLVTCGVGYSFVPVRYGAPAEVLLLTLRRVSETPTEPVMMDTTGLDSLLRRPSTATDSGAARDTGGE
jgi:predicted MPP superfamily phosphohydrolase